MTQHIDEVLKTMLEEMIRYPTRDNVLPKYQIILSRIREFFSAVKNSPDEKSASIYFDQLQEIHRYLAILVFKEKIDEYESINKFVSDFDRLDDVRLRNYIFNAIKNKNYSLAHEKEINRSRSI